MPDGWRPLEPDRLKLIGLLQRSGDTAESLPVAVDNLARFGDQPHPARVRLELAQRLVREERPAKALRVLAEITDADLPEDLRAIRRRLHHQAQRLRDEGVLELEEPSTAPKFRVRLPEPTGQDIVEAMVNPSRTAAAPHEEGR